ncbi:MAG: elongation factor Tu [Bacteroidota bacterium]
MISDSFKRPPRAPDIEAVITAIATEDGGRQQAARSGYRPSHNFGRSDGLLNDAMHEYPDAGSLLPGRTTRVCLWLLAPDLNEGRLYEGMPFTVQEGRRIVGYGVVTRVCTATLEMKA